MLILTFQPKKGSKSPRFLFPIKAKQVHMEGRGGRIAASKSFLEETGVPVRGEGLLPLDTLSELEPCRLMLGLLPE